MSKNIWGSEGSWSGLFGELIGMLCLMALIFGLPWLFAAFDAGLRR